MKLGIIGGGRAAWAFGSAWKSIGRELTGIATRSASEVAGLLRTAQLEIPDLAHRSDVLLVAVTDSALPGVAAQLGPMLSRGTAAFHPSGSQSSDVFAPHPRRFSLHPLRSLPPVGERCDFADTLFSFEGADETRELAREFVSQLNGRFTEIAKEKKPLYHAAAVFASNYVEALLEIAQDTIRDSGISAEVRRELATLAESAVQNWLRGEFTGPLARGDRALIESHLRALSFDAERAELYRRLADALAKALQKKSF